MAVNLDKPHLWKQDIALSVDMYNDWFMKFAPEAYRETRLQTTKDVESALMMTENLINISPAVLQANPGLISTLRMSTCPPLAVDRLIGLSGASANTIKCMESGGVPKNASQSSLNQDLVKVGALVQKMVDPDIFVWLGRTGRPTDVEVHRAATIIADRLCGSKANPIIRNAQEKRQLAAIASWLEQRGYRKAEPGVRFDSMSPGTYSFRMNVPVRLDGGTVVNIPIDTIIMPLAAQTGSLPLFFEAKSAGDFTNVNKRRKEEAVKMQQLRNTLGPHVKFSLFLCGYFNTPYLGYEAAEGIDWVWEHRIDDLEMFGLGGKLE